MTKNKILIISSMCLLLCICVGYAAFETNISITAKGNVVKNVRVIQSWDSTSQTDFHSDFYKENIVSITFLDNNNIPSEATYSWNVSEDQEDGSVMAWVVPNSSDNTKYDLYIGAKGGVIANEDSSYIFYNFTAVEFIAFNNNYDTSNVTNMRSMFQNCTSINVIDVSSFDTSNVTSMRGMFAMWDNTNNSETENNLTNIYFGDNFDTSKVTQMQYMFLGCTELVSIDLSGFNTENVTSMASMFSRCRSLSELDVSSFNTSKVTDMTCMFDFLTLEKLDLTSFDTRNVTSMVKMFTSSENLTKICVGENWTTEFAATDDMFLNCGVSSVTTGQC